MKKYICFLFVSLIVVIPLLFRPKFSFDLCYYVDDKLYSADMYVITSNKELSIKKNSYVFESVEQGNYSIIVEPYKQDENKIILEFVNCQGYDLMPVRIYMNIEIIKVNNEIDLKICSDLRKKVFGDEELTINIFDIVDDARHRQFAISFLAYNYFVVVL